MDSWRAPGLRRAAPSKARPLRRASEAAATGRCSLPGASGRARGKLAAGRDAGRARRRGVHSLPSRRLRADGELMLNGDQPAGSGPRRPSVSPDRIALPILRAQSDRERTRAWTSFRVGSPTRRGGPSGTCARKQSRRATSALRAAPAPAALAAGGAFEDCAPRSLASRHRSVPVSSAQRCARRRLSSLAGSPVLPRPPRARLPTRGRPCRYRRPRAH